MQPRHHQVIAVVGPCLSVKSETIAQRPGFHCKDYPIFMLQSLRNFSDTVKRPIALLRLPKHERDRGSDHRCCPSYRGEGT